METRQVRAAIAPEALARLSRFFNAGTKDILRELFQNARRAGARTITLQTAANGSVVVRDNGRGVARAEDLLGFGRSGWNDPATGREDPAGMGFYALGHGETHVASRRSGEPAWHMTLTERVFSGEASATVVTDDKALAPGPGTEIRFQASGNPEETCRIAADCARLLDVGVKINGLWTPRENFLAGCKHRRIWQGLWIAAFRHRHENVTPRVDRSRPETWHLSWPLARPGEINVHGNVVQLAQSPIVPERDCFWSARVEVIDNANLQLTLPAGKQIVEGRLLDDLREAMRETLYAAIQQWERETGRLRLPYRAIEEAAKRRIKLRGAPAELLPYSPPNGREHYDDRQPDGVGPRGAVMDAPELSRDDGHALAEALKRDGTEPERPSGLYEAEPAYKGYAWYDALPRVRAVRVVIRPERDQDGTMGPDPAQASASGRPTADIDVVLEMARTDAPPEQCRIAGRIAFPKPASERTDAIRIVLTHEHGYQLEELTELLEDTLRPIRGPGGADLDIEEMEDERITEDAYKLAVRALFSETAAAKHQIARACGAAGAYVPPGYTAHVRLRVDHRPAVHLQPTTRTETEDEKPPGSDG